MARNCRNSSVSLTTYSIVARSVRITLNSSLKIRAAMNLDLDNRPDCSNMVRNRAWPASSRLTVSRRMAGFGLGNLPPFSPCAGTLFLVVHIYVFMWYNSTGWNCRRQLPPTICDFGANCSPPRASVFAAKRSGAAKNTTCYVLANINLSSLKRKERFRGKRGLTTDGRQTAHFRLDAAKLGSDIISCISLTLATLCQIEATCAHRWNRRKNGRPMMAEPTAEDVPEWDA